LTGRRLFEKGKKGDAPALPLLGGAAPLQKKGGLMFYSRARGEKVRFCKKGKSQVRIACKRHRNSTLGKKKGSFVAYGKGRPRENAAPGGKKGGFCCNSKGPPIIAGENRHRNEKKKRPRAQKAFVPGMTVKKRRRGGGGGGSSDKGKNVPSRKKEFS